jgi:RTX calcium-binding nonapeptide repeat (4 copies)
MTGRFWTNVGRWVGLALLVAALVPAMASAAAFQRVGPAPGGDDLAVIKGVPYVTWAASNGVHVARLAGGNVWVPVGGAIRHASGRAVGGPPSLTSDANGVPWIAWTERDSNGTPQARVAKFSNGSWHEVVGGARPINIYVNPNQGPSGAYDPQIVFFKGVPYVVYIQDNPAEFVLDAVRLSSNGTKWNHISPQAPGRAENPRVAVSGGHLYIAGQDGLAAAFYVLRLNDAGTKWEQSDAAPDMSQPLGDIADVGGAPVLGYAAQSFEDQSSELRAQTLGSDGTWTQLDSAAATATDPNTGIDPQGVAGDGSVPYVSGLRGGELLVSRFTGGAWESIDSPSASAISAQLAPGSTGGIWLLFGERSGGTTTYYLDTLGATAPPTPAPGPPEPTPAEDHCSRTVNGTPGNDRVTGTHLGDSLFGFGGNDALLGFAGSDCLFGGSGNDYLSGAAGNDYLSGGPGNDELRGGNGNDDLNGNAGNDVIVGGRGEDEIAAGSGNDRIYVAAQGADLVDCGPGRDTVVISRIDGVRNCERVIIKP